LNVTYIVGEINKCEVHWNKYDRFYLVARGSKVGDFYFLQTLYDRYSIVITSIKWLWKYSMIIHGFCLTTTLFSGKLALFANSL